VSAVESTAALVGVGQALRRLRGAVSLDALFREATHALCESVGFERAAFFSLHGSALVPESVHFRGLRDGELPPEELYPKPLRLAPHLHECEVLRRRQTLVVADAARDPHALATLPGATSYVAAPVVCEERPVGLVHADRGLAADRLDELDRAAVSAFAEGFGHAVERGVLAERLRSHTERVLALAHSTEASVMQLASTGTELPPATRRPAPLAVPAFPGGEPLGVLTRREQEVLAMLAEGETNAGIASRLVVSQDTVKTHVKHVLRKLGVNNRSQAVSKYFKLRQAEEAPRAPGTGRVMPFADRARAAQHG
jgi:LuxR family transcriptional regulator, regulator of acetate metabolism